MSDSVDNDCLSIIIASSIVIFGNSLLESIALMYLKVNLVQYLAFKDRIARWSISCVTEVVFGDKKMRNITVNPGICGCAGELSTINATYDSESIQPFVCALYIHSKDFTFLKHVGFLAFAMTSSGSFFTRSTRCSHSGESNFTLFTTSVFFYSRG